MHRSGGLRRTLSSLQAGCPTCPKQQLRMASTDTPISSSGKASGPQKFRQKKPASPTKRLVDPYIEGADPVICLQNAVKMVNPKATYVALDACVKRDLESIKLDGQQKDLLVPRLAPGDISSAFLLLSKNRKDFADRKLTVETEVSRLAKGVSDILQDGARNPSTFFRANSVDAVTTFRSGRTSAGYLKATSLWSKAKLQDAQPGDKALILSAAIRGLSSFGRVEHASELLEGMIKKDSLVPSGSTVMHLFKNLGYIGKIEDAVSLLNLMKEKKIPITPPMLAGIIFGYGHERKISSATKYFDDVTRMRLSPETDPFAAIIRAHALRHQPAEALQAFRNLRSAGLPASSAIFSDMIRVHGAAGDMTSAIKFLHKNDNVKGFSKTPEMIAAAVDAYAFNGELTSAWRQVSEALEKFGAFSFLTLANLKGLAIVHSSLDVKMTTEIMTTAGINPGNQAVIAVTLARALIRDRELNAVEAAEASDIPLLPTDVVRPDLPVAAEKALAILNEATSEQGAFYVLSNASRQTKASVKPLITLARAYDGIMAAHLTLGNHAKAVETFETIEKLKLPVIRRAWEHLLEAGCGLQNKALISKAVVELQDGGGELSPSLIERIIQSAGISLNDGKLMGSDSADTGVGSVSEVVEEWVKAGGVPSAASHPILAAYVKQRGLKLLFDGF
ncbi:hypothetical protein HDU67_008303 [Dinochytrium kinnereticum]|nr:hypothetical protein HDU67_008303 [Dinochytrium kinnereticum]